LSRFAYAQFNLLQIKKAIGIFAFLMQYQAEYGSFSAGGRTKVFCEKFRGGESSGSSTVQGWGKEEVE
jgi:hypothetical protein